MTINVERDYDIVTLEISGRLDTTTAPNLENAICELPQTTKELVFDMTEVEYISSAGIRVLLKAYKMMSDGGAMKIMGINETVREVFDMTGLSQMLL